MATIDSDDLGVLGYFLPEDSQFRLRKLREYVQFLATLARPRTSDEEQAWNAEIRMGEVAICLELLAEQMERVLDALSWPAQHGRAASKSEADTATEAGEDAWVAGAAESDVAEQEGAEPEGDEPGKRLLFGVSLDQIDQINLLLSSLRAHGNVVTCSDHAELSDVTLSVMGDAITRDAEKLRDLMDEVNAQTLKPPHATKPGVREAPATYLALPACRPIGSASYAAQLSPTCH